MNIAVIPARSGSKRIPKKNIKPFLGKPIIAYSIEAALSSNIFDRVIVSTDSDEIAKIALNYGAEVPFIRPKNLSDDFSGTHEVVGHAIKSLELDDNLISYVCCIYATVPMIQTSDLKDGLNLMKTNKWHSVIAATSFSYPIFRSFERAPSGGLKMVFPEHYSSRSQDLPEIYHDAGQFYWAKPEIWKQKPSKFDENTAIIELPPYRVQDIDTLEDWKRAEIIYKYLQEND
jgi:pseudaminic acid cytidylyltransferase